MQVQPVKFQDDKLSATVCHHHDRLWIALSDLATGAEWGESPLMRIEVYNKMEKRVEALDTYQIDVLEVVNGGAHVFVSDAWRSISFGLWIRIVDGELSIFMQPMEVYERDARLYRIFNVKLMPGLMTTGPGGHLLLPLLAGALSFPDDKPKLSDRFMIYGQQERWELLPMLPFCGVSAANGGLVAVPVSCAADTECHVATDGKGNGEVALGFVLRQSWLDPVDFDNREIRYAPIPKGQTPYIFAAKRVRKHAMDDLGKKTLKERAQESPEAAYLIDAFIMKMFYGLQKHKLFPYPGDYKPGDPRFDGQFHVGMTFREGIECLKRLHDAGIDKIVTEAVGWNSRGHDGLLPMRVPPDERVGGEKQFRELMDYGNSLGYHMNVHDNYIDAYRDSATFDVDTTIIDIHGEPLVSGLWAGGINYRQWGLALPHDRLEGEMQKLQELGCRGHLYLDAIGNPLEINYHRNNGGPRSGHVKGVVRMLEAAKQVFGSSGAEWGFLYSAIPSDCITNIWFNWPLKNAQPEWPIAQLCDKHVPIWQLAMHGLTMLEGHGYTWKDVMTKILFANHPRAEWSKRRTIFPSLNEVIGAMKVEYDLVLGKFGHLQTLEMVDYQDLLENVRQSKFEDGTVVVADFAEERLTVNGKQIEQPEGLR